MARRKVIGLGRDCAVSTLAESYVDKAATGVGTVAEMAAERKLAKYIYNFIRHIGSQSRKRKINNII